MREKTPLLVFEATGFPKLRNGREGMIPKGVRPYLFLSKI